MFSKILIANRGEIACRITRTCRRLGVKTVAIRSDHEAHPLHAELADEVTILPEAPNPVAAYLDVDNVVDAAREAGAEAIHPGYGFLSENPDLPRASEDAGIAFVGPSADVIHLMGNKREARRRLAQAGVPVLPGTVVDLDGSADLEQQASEVGFPLMVKASEGGGGIGMHVVADPARLQRALTRTRSSSRRAFGSEDVYLERFIPDARHIEVQIIADGEGWHSHLWERECSVQRRHQKVIEEARSPSISESARERLLCAAVHGSRSVGYRNVGTFEFIMDPEDNFYFLEANTRLQVEHGTTEMVTGVDMVEQQLLIAAGLPATADHLQISGHAIECRIYAEDPETFIPSPGTLEDFHVPSLPNLRMDTGFRAGDNVSSFFDPLLAKVIAWGESRESSISLMADALAGSRVKGVKTNIPALQKAIAHPDFTRGRYTTDLLGNL